MRCPPLNRIVHPSCLQLSVLYEDGCKEFIHLSNPRWPIPKSVITAGSVHWQEAVLVASAASAEGETPSSAKSTPAATVPLPLRKHGGQDVVHLSAPAPKAAALRSTLLNLLIRPACKQALSLFNG